MLRLCYFTRGAHSIGENQPGDPNVLFIYILSQPQIGIRFPDSCLISRACFNIEQRFDKGSIRHTLQKSN
jgi:hypothetical protein